MAKEKDNELTPMMRQYLEIKEQHKDEVLFFRLGDFYEMFFEDAIEVSHLLSLTLTHRAGNPMCGIPYHAAKSYLKRLLDMGKKVAICEQLSLPENSKELAKREVIQIYSPGTVIEDEYLDSESDSFIISVWFTKKEFAIAYADITTGEFFVRHVSADQLFSVLLSLSIKEIIVEEDYYFTNRDFRSNIDDLGIIVNKYPARYFSIRDGENKVKAFFDVNSTAVFMIDEKDSVLGSAGALITYLEQMCKTSLKQFTTIKVVNEFGYLQLDRSSEKNLELITNLQDHSSSNTLFSAINRTITSSGARLLKERLLHPITDIAEINSRLSWVKFFFDNLDERKRVRELLRESSDLIRISSKLDMKKSVPRNLIAIAQTLTCFFSLVSEKESYLNLVNEDLSNPNLLIDLANEIINSINPDCTNLYKEGEIILSGYDSQLDELRNIEASSSQLLSSYLEKVKQESGLTIIKLGDNKIIGYFLEIPKGQLDKVPPYFIRRQTLVGGERFTTPELSELEEKIKSAAFESAKKEKEIYTEITRKAAELSKELRLVGSILAKLDLYQSCAEIAQSNNYTMPELIKEGELNIIEGRHPVVEDKLIQSQFVANSFNSIRSHFALITGPNMAGKSTFLRQTALIVLLAHAGMFVPATKAVIPLTDRIFTRVGASDNLAKGESTFLVEMRESAYIVRNATSKSLVIMDEIGRGTSTQDGMSIAYAIMQYLFNLGCITLFATHYHELTMLDTSLMQLLTLEVVQDKNDIHFVRKVIDGVAESSYGLHVAKLAGIPQSLIRAASNFQKQHFASYNAFNASQQLDLFTDTSEIENKEIDKLIDMIMDFDVTSSTPIDALLLVSKLQSEIQNNSKKGDK